MIKITLIIIILLVTIIYYEKLQYNILEAKQSQEYVWALELSRMCIETGELPPIKYTEPFKSI